MRRIDPDRLGTTDEQLVHWVIGQAILANAQDLHVMFERSSGVFRISKDGILQTLYSFSEQRWGSVVGILRDLSKMSGPFFQAISSRFSVLFDGSPVDFRVEATPFRDFERPPEHEPAPPEDGQPDPDLGRPADAGGRLEADAAADLPAGRHVPLHRPDLPWQVDDHLRGARTS